MRLFVAANALGLRRSRHAIGLMPTMDFEGLWHRALDLLISNVYEKAPQCTSMNLQPTVEDLLDVYKTMFHGRGLEFVVCVERDQQVPKRVWVRIRTKVKAYPLEKIRLATADEMLSAEYITGALKDVMKELENGQLQVVEEPAQLGDAPLPVLPEEDEVGGQIVWNVSDGNGALYHEH